MPTVEVERLIAAPIEQVFDLLTDHANMKQFPGISASELAREGQPDVNGLGALRKITFRPIRFEEEITAYERPSRMDYLIRKVNLPVHHEGGTMRFEATEGGTKVTWRSTFHGTTPAVGGLVAGAAAPVVRRGFTNILKDAERRLTGASASPQPVASS
jgi:uncharacterized protein YndB with AHSA1/START domain